LGEPWHCIDSSREDPKNVSCRWKIVDSELAKREKRSFVRLYEDPYPNRMVKHVVVEPTSQVELIEAEVPLELTRTKALISFGMAESETGDDATWLHVRIDGVDGWLHTAEDYDALGLPFMD